MLTLRAFGALDLRDAVGAPVTSVLTQPKRSALLAYLLLSRPGGFHRRDSLLAMFWPETDAEHARGSLRKALSFLRHELEEGIVVTRGGEEVGVDPSRVDCDVLAFGDAVAREDWEGALELYRGDLLEGLHVREAPEFVDWVDRERVRLREAAAGAAWRGAHQLIGEGRAVEAERKAQRALGLVPTEESPVRAFIVALAEAGERGAALGFYEKFRDVLGRELGVEPAPETEAAVRAVRNGEIRGSGPGLAGGEAPPARPLSTSRASSALPPAAIRSGGHPRRATPILSRRALALGVSLLAVVALAAVWRWRDPERTPGTPDDIRPAIAVLPCESLNPDTEDALYAEGVHDAILTRLQMVAGIVSIGRASVLRFQGNPVPPSQIAAELHVGFLGECSVLKAGGRIQVRFRLMEAVSGRQVWAGTFDAMLDMNRLIEMESGIARRVVEGVGARLTPEEQARMATLPTESLSAYELYLVARNRRNHFTPEGRREAIGFLEAAIGQDSTFAQAWALLGEILLALPFADLTVNPRDVEEAAREAVTRAHTLDPSLGEVQTAMGLLRYIVEWDWAGAEPHFAEGVRVSPGYEFGHYWYGAWLSGMGRVEEGAEQGRLMLESDPLSSGMLWSAGHRMWHLGRTMEARALLERALRIEPPVPWAFAHLAHLYALQEPKDAARSVELWAEFARWFGYPSPERTGPVARAMAGDSSAQGEALAVLDDVVARTVLERPHLVFEYAKCASEDMVFDILDEAVRTRGIWVPWVPIHFAAMRVSALDDPRWRAFLDRIGHPGIRRPRGRP